MKYKKLLSFFLVLFCISLGLYFRSYALHKPVSNRSSQEIARLIILDRLKDQFKQKINLESPHLSESEKEKIARDEAQSVISIQKDEFDQAVSEASKNLQAKTPVGTSRQYLLESDPYHYFYLTREVVRNGRISEKIENNKYYHPLRHAPFGLWSVKTFHPYLGYWWSRVFNFFNRDADLMEALCYFPLFMIFFVVLAFWFASKIFGHSIFATFMGCLALVLSPIFIQRSGFGWYDTDVYQYIFPPIIFALSVLGIRNENNNLYFGALAGFLTSFYSFFWSGWPFVFLLVLGSGALLIVLTIRLSKLSIFKFLILYLLSVGISSIFLMGPSAFFEFFSDGVRFVGEFAQTRTDIWPNAFLTVSEAAPISMAQLFKHAPSHVFVFISLWGFLAACSIILLRNSNRLFQSLFLVLGFLSTFQMALATERFAVVWMLFFAFCVSAGIQNFESGAAKLFPRFSSAIKKAAVIFALVILTLPRTLRSADTAAQSMPLIMNDAWYQALEEIKSKTPENAIINSWWPPGYFIQSIAERKTIVDGGTQYFPETYWMSKFFLSGNEREAAGILRMVNTSGNQSVDFLQKKGYSAGEAVDFILDLLRMNDEEMTAKLTLFTESDRSIFSKLLNSDSLNPAYIFVYNDAIEQNLALSIMAGWDFRKAKEFQEKAPSGSLQENLMNLKTKAITNLIYSGFNRFNIQKFKTAIMQTNLVMNDILPNRKLKKVVEDVIEVTGGFLKYLPESTVVKREGNVLHFSDGAIINLDLMDAVVNLPEQNLSGRPVSLFYLEAGEFKEKVFSGQRVDVSCLLIQNKERYATVLADPKLIRSLLFRLYYLDGKGFQIFEPFIVRHDPLTRTTIKVFAVNWSKLRA